MSIEGVTWVRNRAFSEIYSVRRDHLATLGIDVSGLGRQPSRSRRSACGSSQVIKPSSSAALAQRSAALPARRVLDQSDRRRRISRERNLEAPAGTAASASTRFDSLLATAGQWRSSATLAFTGDRLS
jgi:hypothetical protein